MKLQKLRRLQVLPLHFEIPGKVALRKVWGWLNSDVEMPSLNGRNRIPLLTGPKPKMLPAPPDPLLKAKSRFGFDIRAVGSENVAVIEPLDNHRPEQVVGIHERPPNLAGVLKAGAVSFSVTNRVVWVDTTLFHAALARAKKELPWEPLYLRLLDAAKAHFDSRGEFAREALVTGPSGLAIGVPEGAANSIAQGRPARFDEIGHILWASATRGDWRSGNPDVAAEHPLVYANADLRWRDSYYQVGGGGQKFGIWSLIPHGDDEDLKMLQNLPVDIIAHFENLGGDRLWTRLVVRASGSERELADIDAALHSIGRAERVPGFHPWESDLKTVHYASLPGSARIPPVPHFSVRKWREFLQNMVSEVDATGVRRGDMPIGRSLVRERPVFYSWEDRPTIAVEGPTGSGKTTLAFFLALLRTYRVVLVHMTSAESEAPGNLAVKLGGQYLNLELPEPKTAAEFSRVASQVEAEVERTVNRWREVWLKTGHAEGLPLVLRRKSGSPVVFAYYASVFLRRLAKLFEEFYLATGHRSMLIADDLIGIPGETPDEHLGEISVNKGRELRHELQVLTDTVRKIGLNLILTVHSREEFQIFGAGFWRSLPLCLTLPAGVRHRRGQVWYPPDTRLDSMIEDIEQHPGFRGWFNPYLPPPILGILLAN